MILSVVKAPHSRLKVVCGKADPKSAHHRTLARSLVETVKANKAYGIAANQVFPGPLIRIIAVATKEYTGAMFNPEIVSFEGEITSMDEGCLSLKQEYKVPRMSIALVSFQTISGETKTISFKGVSSIVVQHEIDHLNGILASDYFDKSKEPS
jgi:peptide deformylase